MTNPATKPPSPRSNVAAAIGCGVAGFILFQFFGNATRGYIPSTSLFYWWGFQWVNPGSETEHGWLILGLSIWVWWRNLGIADCGLRIAEISSPESGVRRPESGEGRPDPAGQVLETGVRKPETGGWRPPDEWSEGMQGEVETGYGELETGKTRNASSSPSSGLRFPDSGFLPPTSGFPPPVSTSPQSAIRNPQSKDPLLPAVGVMVGALALHALGFAAQQTRLSILAFLLFTWGVVRLGGGRRWGNAAMFPLAFMVFAIPISALDEIGLPLRLWVTDAGERIAHLAGIDLVRSGTQLVAPDGRFNYDVAAPCSGVRSLMALTALSVLVGYLNFRSWWRRALVLGLSFPLVYLGNVARIVAIIFAAQAGGPVWGDRAHDVMGYGVFVIVLGGVMGAVAIIRKWRPEAAEETGVRRLESGVRSPESGGSGAEETGVRSSETGGSGVQSEVWSPESGGRVMEPGSRKVHTEDASERVPESGNVGDPRQAGGMGQPAIGSALSRVSIPQPPDSGLRTPASRLRPPVSRLRIPVSSAVVLFLIGLEMLFLHRLAQLPPRGQVGILLAADGVNPAELPAFLGTDWIGQRAQVSEVEREILPPDTGFSRKNYAFVPDRTRDVFLSIVLSGRDRTSIHRPELCLVGQGWTIEGASRQTFHLPGEGRHEQAEFPATVLRVRREVPSTKGPVVVPQLVAYWFVAGDVIVASHWKRFLHDAWNRVARARADRWAYVLMQTDARDGEAAALARMQTVLDGTLPAFQKVVVAGRRP